MPRNSAGYLKQDALRMGVPEQYAVIQDGERHVVEIVWDRDRGGAVARHLVAKDGHDEVTEWQCGADVSLAREHFRREARALGGRV